MTNIYMSVGLMPSDNTKILAIISEGSPQKGDAETTVLTMETFPAGTLYDEIWKWFEKMKVERPWERRQ